MGWDATGEAERRDLITTYEGGTTHIMYKQIMVSVKRSSRFVLFVSLCKMWRERECVWKGVELVYVGLFKYDIWGGAFGLLLTWGPI